MFCWAKEIENQFILNSFYHFYSVFCLQIRPLCWDILEYRFILKITLFIVSPNQINQKKRRKFSVRRHFSLFGHIFLWGFWILFLVFARNKSFSLSASSANVLLENEKHRKKDSKWLRLLSHSLWSKTKTKAMKMEKKKNVNQWHHWT